MGVTADSWVSLWVVSANSDSVQSTHHPWSSPYSVGVKGPQADERKQSDEESEIFTQSTTWLLHRAQD